MHTGAEVSAHFDSMLVKLTCHGHDFANAAAPGPPGDRGVPDPRGLHQHPVPRRGAGRPGVPRPATSPPVFIEEHPDLIRARPSADRGTKLLSYLAETTVNQPHGPRPQVIDPVDKLPGVALGAAPPEGSRQLLAELGPEAFAARLRSQSAVAVTDTTFRDAHQSLLATRVRTRDLLAVAPYVAHTAPQLLSLECWGGATYDVALRFLAEDPWERLAALRAAVPNLCMQMLLRGRNTVGYTPYPVEVTQAFVAEAAATGIDIFRIFDALNDVSQMRPAIDAVRATGTAVAEVALCYTADLSDPAETLYTLDYYLRLAEQIVEAGAHVLAIKDMAGLLRAAGRAHAGHRAARPLRPAGAPAHPRHRGRPAGHPGRGDRRGRGRGGRRGAPRWRAPPASRRCPRWSRPPTTPTGPPACPCRPSATSSRTGRRVRKRLRAVRVGAGLRPPAGSTTTRSPAASCRTCASRPSPSASATGSSRSRTATRRPTGCWAGSSKVTPSSKVVGDLALHLVGAGVRAADFEADPGKYDMPDSVIGFLRGELGDPPGGWPEPFRTRALRGRATRPEPPTLTDEDREGLRENRRGTLNRLLFPGPAKEFAARREAYGDTSVLPTKDFFYGMEPEHEHTVTLEPGVTLLIELEAISEADERGYRTVLATLNGQLRPVSVRDASIATTVKQAEKAEKGNPRHVAAPFAGVVTLQIEEGAAVAAGQTVATIEAMKMEASITAQHDGTVRRLAIGEIQQVEAGDLLIEIN